MDVDTDEPSTLRQILGEALAGAAAGAVENIDTLDAADAIDAIIGPAQPAPGQADAREGQRQFPRLMPVASAAQPGARAVKVADIAGFERLAEQDALTPTLAGLAKLHNTSKARAVLAEARDLLGGNGILLDFHVIRHMTDIESIHTFEGTETMQTLIVGRDISGTGAFS